MKLIGRFLLLILTMFIAGLLHAQLTAPPSDYDIVKNVPHGTMKIMQYYSTTVGNNRNVRIYTPPGYSKAKSYNVLYLMHGIGGDENEWNYYCSPDVILDNLFAKGTIEPMVVVFPNGRAMKDDKSGGDIFAAEKVAAFANFEFDLIKDLIPYVEKNYSVVPERLHRAIAGYSMGGGQSINIGLRNLDLIAWVGGFACGPNTKSDSELVTNPEDVKDKMKLLWLSCGSTDGLLNVSQRVHSLMTQKNIPHIWQLEAGLGHETLMWKRSLYHLLPLLFKGISNDTITSNRDKNVVIKDITCYPSPFSHDFNIELKGLFEYAVYDSTGKEWNKGTAQNMVTLGREFPSGTYTVKIHIGMQTQILKIIKN